MKKISVIISQRGWKMKYPFILRISWKYDLAGSDSHDSLFMRII